MGIDIHSPNNRITYTTRNADKSWIDEIKKLVPIKNISKALDIGCGGGIYSKALSDMGIDTVIGVDFSKEMLEGAKENCKEYKNISFKHGDAFHTGLQSNSFDLLLERALIHHLENLEACFNEAYRVLKEDGFFIVQDRTPEDCLVKGSESHIRGFFFEFFPRLIKKEINRRHNRQSVMETLQKVGFRNIEEVKLWETRKVYVNKAQLLHDIQERTGRSILHELDDKELKVLINHIEKSIVTGDKIVERDRWTIWRAVK